MSEALSHKLYPKFQTRALQFHNKIVISNEHFNKFRAQHLYFYYLVM